MKKTSIQNSLVPLKYIERKIYMIRGQKVIFDHDLAELYQVPTKAINQTVKRNRDRFPTDFTFQLSTKESDIMRSQFVTASKRNVTSFPCVFTEHGVAMLSSVLKSDRLHLSLSIEKWVSLLMKNMGIKSIFLL